MFETMNALAKSAKKSLKLRLKSSIKKAFYLQPVSNRLTFNKLS